MNQPALERTSLLLTTLTLAAIIGVLIPTLAFAQSSQIANYYGSASGSSPQAKLNGSVIQSTSNGNSSGMPVMRSQAASKPYRSASAFGISTGSNSLFSNDALSNFATSPAGTTTNFTNALSPSNRSAASATIYNTSANSSNADSSSADPFYSKPSSANPADQLQADSSQFDINKAIKLGTSMLHGFNQLVSATRPANNVFNGANQMTNSLLNQSSALGAGSSFLNGSIGQLFQIGRPLNRNEINLLANYDVAVIIDKSGSMQTQDCPGGLSRWDFCREQLLNLTSQVGSAFRSGITVALFSSGYRIFNNVNFAAVPEIFAANSPDGGTYLARPLRDILSTHFAQRDSNMANQLPTRPLLIEIITDGEPNDKSALIKVICQATQEMSSAREVNIQFLQIGHDNEGGRVLNELETRLVPDDGAQYPIVNVESFGEVLNEGLACSLVSAASRH